MINSTILHDKILIEWIYQGGKFEDKAIRYILKHQKSKLIAFVIKYNFSNEEAEDILYESITELLLNVRSYKFNSDSSLATYLFAIAKGITFKRIRKASVQRKWEEHEKTTMETIYDPEGVYIKKEYAEQVQNLLKLISDSCKEVLTKWSLGFNMSEIAESLSFKSAQIAMNKKNLCLKKLKASLKDKPNLMGELLKLIQKQ